MRTEQEIKELLMHDEEILQQIEHDPNFEELWLEHTGRIRAYKVVLEKPEYKRTIFDLTDAELLELAGILNPYLISDKVEFRTYKKDEYIILIFEPVEMSHLMHILLYPNLNFEARHVATSNQVEYVNAIQNMLVKEAEGEN